MTGRIATERKSGPEHNTNPQQQGQNPHSLPARTLVEVLFNEEQHCAVEQLYVADLPLFCAFSLVVNDLRTGRVADGPPCFLDPETQIQVFAIHEKLLIEQARFIERGAPDHHTGPGQCIDLAGLGFWNEGHIVAPERAALREEAAQAGHPIEGGRWRRERPATLGCKTAVGVQYAAPRSAAIRMRTHEGHKVGERVFLDNGVWIKDENERSPRLPDSLVVGATEPDIFPVGNNVYVGKGLTDGCDRVVNGIVVDDPNLSLQAAHGVLQAAERLHQELANVVINNYDRDIDRCFQLMHEAKSRLRLMGKIRRILPAMRKVHAYRSEVVRTMSLAVPIVVTQLAHISMSFVDTIMVGRLGADELAGVALGNTVFFSMLIFCMGILMAVGPMVSQAHGAGDVESVGRSVRQGLWMMVILGMVGFALIRNADIFLRLTGQTSANISRSVSYLDAIGWGVFPFLGFVALRSFMEAVSRPRVVTAIALLGVGLNIGANWVLMYGHFGFPAMGLVGTGWASTAVFTFNFIALLIIVAWDRSFAMYGIFSRLGRPDPTYFRELVRIGWPIGTSMGVEMGLFMATVLMMGWISTTALAAHQVALQCAAFSFMVPVGIGMATSVRVGHSIGERNFSGARRAGLTGMGLSAGFMAIAAVFFWLMPERLVGLYLDTSLPANAPVVELAVSLLAFAAVFQVVDGIQVSAMGALRGLKDTRAPMILAVVSYWGLGLTSGYLLAFHAGFGEQGLWMGLVVGLAGAAVLLSRRFLVQIKM